MEKKINNKKDEKQEEWKIMRKTTTTNQQRTAYYPIQRENQIPATSIIPPKMLQHAGKSVK